MKKIILAVAMFLAGLTGAQADVLSDCLVRNTTEADKAVMTKWVFTSLSNHPSLTDMASISQAVKTGADQEMAKLVEKFMYDACNQELKDAVKKNGPTAIQSSIRSYVEVMGRDVLQHPSVSGNVMGLASQFDYKRLFEALMAN